MNEEDAVDLSQETPADNVFIAPSINEQPLLDGCSYTHHSPLPKAVLEEPNVPCVLGVDEAGRGPVLGPMVYGVLYLPIAQHESLLTTKHKFMDSKVLKPAVRSSLMETLCSSDSDLYASCGWATRVMSARDISAGMLQPSQYNLNAQAMSATIELIKETFARGVNVQEVYIDTIGPPKTYQTKLERIFPATKITVAKKADALYPCVSAASVCAKVTRDAALEVCYQAYERARGIGSSEQETWGSGYPADAQTTTWLKASMDPTFGWGSECRFSWGTVKTLIEAKGKGIMVDWPESGGDDQGMKVTDFYISRDDEGDEEEGDELATWYGRATAEHVF